MGVEHVLKLLSSDHIVSAELWHFKRKPVTDSLVLFSQVNIFLFQCLDLGLDFRNNLILLVHLYDRLVSNIHGSRCIV